MKVCLSLFTARDVVKYEVGAGIGLLRPEMTRATSWPRTGQTYRDRHDRDVRKHQEIVGYAESRGCRWRTLLDYFGGERLPETGCGHCDWCKRDGRRRPTPRSSRSNRP